MVHNGIAVVGVGFDRNALGRLVQLLSSGPASHTYIVCQDEMATYTNTVQEFCNTTLEYSNSCLYKPEEPEYDWYAESIQGIREIREWFAARVQQVLRQVQAHAFLRRTVFQPCWSARRWKSLT